MAKPPIDPAPWHAKPLASLAVMLIRGYQIGLSPYLGSHCRYQPTCSNYARQAIERHGIWRGGALSLRRLLRCHPITWLGGGEGYDPVPTKSSSLKANDV
ncbi:MAG: membrane protein insertion efficiency factor YidD [Alphaproteobacteria bacterium]